jgi:hypothetical protein
VPSISTFGGQAVAIAGILLMVTGSTPWVLTAGVVVWLAMAAVTLTGVFRHGHNCPSLGPVCG